MKGYKMSRDFLKLLSCLFFWVPLCLCFAQDQNDSCFIVWYTAEWTWGSQKGQQQFFETFSTYEEAVKFAEKTENNIGKKSKENDMWKFISIDRVGPCNAGGTIPDKNNADGGTLSGGNPGNDYLNNKNPNKKQRESWQFRE